MDCRVLQYEDNLSESHQYSVKLPAGQAGGLVRGVTAAEGRRKEALMLERRSQPATGLQLLEINK